MSDSRSFSFNDGIVLFFVFVMIAFNLYGISQYWPKQRMTLTPGYWMAPLKPFLKDVNVATFYTDLFDPGHPNTVEPQAVYQSSQYTLSPVILLMDNDYHREFAVFYCAVPGCYERLVSGYHYKKVAVFDKRIGVLRKQGP